MDINWLQFSASEAVLRIRIPSNNYIIMSGMDNSKNYNVIAIVKTNWSHWLLIKMVIKFRCLSDYIPVLDFVLCKVVDALF